MAPNMDKKLFVGVSAVAHGISCDKPQNQEESSTSIIVTNLSQMRHRGCEGRQPVSDLCPGSRFSSRTLLSVRLCAVLLASLLVCTCSAQQKISLYRSAMLSPCHGNVGTQQTFVRDPLDCSLFYTCFGNRFWKMSCQTPGTVYSLKFKVCVWRNSRYDDCSEQTVEEEEVGSNPESNLILHHVDTPKPELIKETDSLHDTQKPRRKTPLSKHIPTTPSVPTTHAPTTLPPRKSSVPSWWRWTPKPQQQQRRPTERREQIQTTTLTTVTSTWPTPEEHSISTTPESEEETWTRMSKTQQQQRPTTPTTRQETSTTSTPAPTRKPETPQPQNDDQEKTRTRKMKFPQFQRTSAPPRQQDGPKWQREEFQAITTPGPRKSLWQERKPPHYREDPDRQRPRHQGKTPFVPERRRQKLTPAPRPDRWWRKTLPPSGRDEDNEIETITTVSEPHPWWSHIPNHQQPPEIAPTTALIPVTTTLATTRMPPLATWRKEPIFSETTLPPPPPTTTTTTTPPPPPTTLAPTFPKTTTTEAAPRTSSLPHRQQMAEHCGIMSRPMIIGGRPSRPGQWPWQVSLQIIAAIEPWHRCGGVLIHPSWVLTAAHCVEGPFYGDTRNWRVVLAEDNLEVESGREIYRRIARIVSHPGYIRTSNFPNDVALLQLDDGVDLSTGEVRVACLPDQFTPPPDFSHCWISGWGETRGTGGEENRMNELPVHILDNNDCASMWLRVGIHVLDDQLCVGYGDTGACYGDSGGPLMCEMDGRFYITGVMSWLINNCSARGFPNVFTRVTSYLDWIYEKLDFYEWWRYN